MSIPSSSLRPAVADWTQRPPIGPRADDPAGTRRPRRLANVEHRLFDRLPMVLAEVNDLPTMFTLALAEICRATGWRLGEAWAPRDPETGPLQRVASWASALPDCVESETVSRELSFARGVGLPGRVWAAMRPIWVDDVSACSWYQESVLAYHAGLRTALGFPVSFRGRLVAVFVIYADDVRPREDDLVHLLSNAAGPLGAVLAGYQSLQLAERTRRELLGLADAIAEGVVIVDAEGMITFANDEVGRIMDVDATKLAGRALNEFDSALCSAGGAPHPDPGDAPIARVLRNGEPVRDEVVGLRSERPGSPSIVSVNATPQFDESGALTRVVASFRDITERENSARDLQRSEERFARAFRANPLAMGIVTLDGFRYLEVNEGLEELFELPREEILGRELADLPVESESGIVEKLTAAIARTGRVRDQEFWVRSATGQLRELLFFGEAVELDDEACLLGVAHDITDRKRIEQELEELALRDTLTGLPNRNLFQDRLGHAFERCGRRPESLAVMFIDLDRFKVVNDSLGHSAGDELLVAVTDRLRACCRRQDTIARVGGDEFAVVLEHLESPDEAAEISHRMSEAFESGFDIDGKTLHLTSSIGVAFGSDDIERASDLLRYADVAMQRTKEEGGAGCKVFDPKLDLSATRRLDREDALREAIDEQELFVRYQPIISCRTGRIVGAEALVAWQHPEEGLTFPGEFIPLAEETGLVIPLGRFVLRHAAEMVGRWRPLASPECPFSVSVNVSPLQMRSPNFLMDVRDVLRESGTLPSTVVLELTEGVLIRNTEMAVALRDLGVSIAVDDLGTGYASLEYLTRLEFDLLKLDRVFTSGLGSDRSKTAIVESVLLMADRLGVPLIAEGIETAEQLRLLREFRCDYGQGYHIARPMSAEAFERLLGAGPKW